MDQDNTLQGMVHLREACGRGVQFNRFHTTALCSPTRAALLTGRNHHSVNMGGITQIATSAPGYTSSVRRKDKAGLTCGNRR